MFTWRSLLITYRNCWKNEEPLILHRETECGRSFFCKWDADCIFYFSSVTTYVLLWDIFWLIFLLSHNCFYFMIFISLFFHISLIVQKQRRNSAAWTPPASSSVMSAFPEGPPVLDYREPGPPPKKHKYQQSLKTLIPFRFGSQ